MSYGNIHWNEDRSEYKHGRVPQVCNSTLWPSFISALAWFSLQPVPCSAEPWSVDNLVTHLLHFSPHFPPHLVSFYCFFYQLMLCHLHIVLHFFHLSCSVSTSLPGRNSLSFSQFFDWSHLYFCPLSFSLYVSLFICLPAYFFLLLSQSSSMSRCWRQIKC